MLKERRYRWKRPRTLKLPYRPKAHSDASGNAPKEKISAFAMEGSLKGTSPEKDMGSSDAAAMERSEGSCS